MPYELKSCFPHPRLRLLLHRLRNPIGKERVKVRKLLSNTFINTDSSPDPPTSAHLVSFSTPLSHHGVEDYAAPPVERETPRRDEFILEWRNSITGTQEAADGAHGWDTVFNRRLPMVNLHGEWLI
jgi:hypothetical protein